MFRTFLCTQTIGKGSPDSPEAPESLIEELGKTAHFLEILFEEIGKTANFLEIPFEEICKTANFLD